MTNKIRRLALSLPIFFSFLAFDALAQTPSRTLTIPSMQTETTMAAVLPKCTNAVAWFCRRVYCEGAESAGQLDRGRIQDEIWGSGLVDIAPNGYAGLNDPNTAMNWYQNQGFDRIRKFGHGFVIKLTNTGTTAQNVRVRAVQATASRSSVDVGSSEVPTWSLGSPPHDYPRRIAQLPFPSSNGTAGGTYSLSPGSSAKEPIPAGQTRALSFYIGCPSRGGSCSANFWPQISPQWRTPASTPDWGWSNIPESTNWVVCARGQSNVTFIIEVDEPTGSLTGQVTRHILTDGGVGTTDRAPASVEIPINGGRPF